MFACEAVDLDFLNSAPIRISHIRNLSFAVVCGIC
jgi:hypothetical protein